MFKTFLDFIGVRQISDSLLDMPVQPEPNGNLNLGVHSRAIDC